MFIEFWVLPKESRFFKEEVSPSLPSRSGVCLTLTRTHSAFISLRSEFSFEPRRSV